MAWCVYCWEKDRKTITATKVLDEEDVCDLHYRQALGEGLPAMAKTNPAPPIDPVPTEEEKKPMPTAQRICTCKPGCTAIAKSNASPFAKGHNPNAAPKPQRIKREKQPTGIILPPPISPQSLPSVTVQVTLQEKHLNDFWARLTLQEKASVLFPSTAN